MDYPICRIVVDSHRLVNYAAMQNYIDRLADAYLSDAKIPPLDIQEDGTLVDGYCRLMAAKRIGWRLVEVRVVDR